MTWFRCPVPRPGAPLRLVCFPHAGGGASFYRWLADLGPDVEVHLAQYPGREGRITERMPSTMDALVSEIVAALPPGPLALFGHSMGAAVAYEVACRVQVTTLIVSGRIPDPPVDTTHLGSGDDILNLVRRLGGTNPEVFTYPELRQIVVDVMRGDLTVLASHTVTPGPALDVPVLALAGESDPAAPPEGMKAWAALTTGVFTKATFPGGHFYLVEQAEAVHASVLKALISASDPGSGHRPGS